jgi:hypothetical protein
VVVVVAVVAVVVAVVAVVAGELVIAPVSRAASVGDAGSPEADAGSAAVGSVAVLTEELVGGSVAAAIGTGPAVARTPSDPSVATVATHPRHGRRRAMPPPAIGPRAGLRLRPAIGR